MKTISFIAVALLSCAVTQAQDPAPPAPIMSVTLLGTGVPLLDPVAYEASGQVTAGLMVNAGTESLLFDCGQGILTRLLQSGNNPTTQNANAAIDRIFISHLHSDHMTDLGAIYNYGWLYRYNDPLEVWGPGPGPNGPISMSSIMPLYRTVYDSDIYIRSALFTLLSFPVSGEQPIGHDLVPGVVYQSNGVKVTAFLVNHNPVTPAYGFRIDYQGHSVVFSGDTTYDPTTPLIAMSTGVDVLIHEVWGYDKSAAPELYSYHTVVEDTVKVFNAAQPKMAVYTHQGIPPGTTGGDLVSRARIAGYTGPLTLGADLMTINVLPTTVSIVNPPQILSSVPSPASAMNRVVPKGGEPVEMRTAPEVRALMPKVR